MLLRTIVVGVAGLLLAGFGAGAETRPAPQAQVANEQVFTRATVRSSFLREPDGQPYMRLQIGPGAGLPFTTLTYRVQDPALLAQFPPGSPVEFRAARVQSENTLTALRPARKRERYDVR